MSHLLTDQEVQNFKALLDNYELHSEVLDRFQNSNFAIIAGPAGAGKDTLRNNLISNYPEIYLPILSTTTRPRRPGEEDGVTYHFREVEEVYDGLLSREYFQAELVHNQQISCLHIDEVTKLQPGQYGLSILITETERKLRRIKQDIKTIFLIPPRRDVLIERMTSQRALSQAEVARRLEAAKQEISQALADTNYYCLVSDTITHVLDRTHDYLQNSNRREADDTSARAVMQKMMIEL